jgi:hypothetical protein
MVKTFTSPSTDLYVATYRSSLAWPPHWKKSIFKLDMYDNVEGLRVYRVKPHNPDWRRYLDSESEFFGSATTQTLPGPHLDSIDFDSVDDLNAWAHVVSRFS